MISWLLALLASSQVPYELLALVKVSVTIEPGHALPTVRYHELFDS